MILAKFAAIRVEKDQKAGFLCLVRPKIPLTKKKERKNSKRKELKRRKQWLTLLHVIFILVTLDFGLLGGYVLKNPARYIKN